MKLYRHLLFFLSLCLLAGCGDMLMSKKEKKMRQMMKCSADPSALSKIFTENIKPELACLGESLKLFVDIVKTDRPGNLSYKELSVYIKKNLDSVDSSLFEPLKGFFEINSLLSGDDPLYIKKENINSLMTMLALINEVMVENRVAEYFTDDSTLDYQEHSKRKAAVFNAFVTMERALRDFFKSNNNEIDLIAFLKKFENMDNSDTLKNSANLLFIKKMFLGGDKKILTARELRRVTMMLGDVSKIAYDIIHLPNVRHSQNEEEEIIESLKENLETLTRNLHIHPHENEPVMTLDDIFAVVGHHFPQFGFLSQYKKSILKAKEIFLNNNSPIFTAKEVKTLVHEILLNNLRRGVYFYKAFSANHHILKSKGPITRNLPFMPAANSLEESFRDDFNRISRDYWFFADNNNLAHYKNGIERSAWGMFLVGALEDLVQRVFSHYVEKDNVSYGGYKLSQKQVEYLLSDFKDALYGSGILLPGREANSAETMTLMTSLFQKQSDGKGDDIEVNEMVEFIVSLMTSYKISELAHQQMRDRCPLDYKGRYSPECFRANFPDVFELETQKDKKVRDYFPGLAAYVEELSSSENDDFVEKIEIFTRSCVVFDDGAPVPMNSSDVFMFFAGALNMESTYTRFDQGDGRGGESNNILDPSELNTAFNEVYEEAIRARIPVKWLKFRARSLFFYLLDFGKEPKLWPIWQMPRALLYAKRDSANRSDVAGVLRVISEGSEANKLNPYPCETLR